MHLNFGQELRRSRESKGLSLRSVATAVGVSPSLLSQVETGKTQPSVSTLYALVNHLGISLDGLMREELSSRATANFPQSRSRHGSRVIQRADQKPTIEMSNGVTWERLADGGNDIADPLLVSYPAGASSSIEGKFMRHSALEYGVILEGELTLKLDFDEQVLRPGDSFCFDADRPHLYENKSDKVARGIWFVISRQEIRYQTFSDMGIDRLPGETEVKSAVDVLNLMRPQRP